MSGPSDPVTPQARNSPTMDRFSRSARRWASVLAQIGIYLLEWGALGIIIGILLAGGAIALTLALVAPSSIPAELYIIAEALFVIGVTLFLVKCAFDFRAHADRRFILKFFAVCGVVMLVGVVWLFQRYRPRKHIESMSSPSSIESQIPTTTATSTSVVALSPTPSPSATTSPSRPASPKPTNKKPHKGEVNEADRQEKLLRKLGYPKS